MKEKRLLGEERMKLGLLNELKTHAGKPRLVSVGPDATVGEALGLMNSHSLSQIPVLDDGKSVGSVRDNRVMAQLLDNRDLLQAPVTQLMDAPFPVVNENVDVSHAKQYLKASPAILVEEYGRIVGIVTRHDVIDIQV
jgi:predicted transcriptional regulator